MGEEYRAACGTMALGIGGLKVAELPATGELANGNTYEILRDGLDISDASGELVDSIAFEDIQRVQRDQTAVWIYAHNEMRYRIDLGDEDTTHKLATALKVALAQLGYISDVLVQVELYRSPQEYREAASAMVQAGWRVVDVSDATSHGGCISFLAFGWLGVLGMKKRSVTVTYQSSLSAYTIEGWGSPRDRVRPVRRARRRPPERRGGAKD